MNSEEKRLNRLKDSKSPYLKSHADNPIDWYPWGEEALLRAVKEDKLIFLSIGYSSCRWCNKMNREVFQNQEVADILNENYIAIKVDKEERPDIDKLYMLFSEALTGVTGWPLNAILTPERITIYSGNYMTVEGRGEYIGIKEILENININWNYRRDEIIEKSSYILRETNRLYNSYEKGTLNSDIFEISKEEVKAIYDWDQGGFYKSPKFLLPQYSLYLLKYYMAREDQEALEMAEDNLRRMYKGKVYDHVAGGFFRYSTDEGWDSPHFEKMIGENILMAILYTEAYSATKDTFYRTVAQDIFKFMIRDMMSEEAAFYTSIDAEYRGEEGAAYFLEEEEVLELLGEEVARIYLDSYNVQGQSSFLPKLEDIDSLRSYPLASINDMLFEYRQIKRSPDIDRKILASMNGLMVGALAQASQVFSDSLMLDRAKRTMDFIVENMMDEDGEIVPIHIDGESYGQALLSDYSYVLYGLINLYQAEKDEKYLRLAETLNENIKKHFWSEESQSLYLNSIDKHDLVLDLKDNNDGSLPSSAGVMAYNWLLLYKLTEDLDYYSLYRNMINSYSGDIIKSPNAHIYSIMSMFYI